MDFSIVPISKIFKTYQGQACIADLNSKSPVKRVQGQRDQVTISSAARQALQKKLKGDNPVPAANVEAAATASKPTSVVSGNFVPGI